MLFLRYLLFSDSHQVKHRCVLQNILDCDENSPKSLELTHEAT